MHSKRRRSILVAPLVLLTIVAGFVQSPVAQAASFDVTTAADSGVGSLREAITSSNATSGQDTITFNIASGAQSISLSSALPAITEGVVIDGTTQGGFAGTPLITVDGGGLSGSEAGLTIQTTSAATVVKGLIIANFPGDGINIIGAGASPPEVTIQGNYIGTGGTNDLGNGGDGIRISGNDITGVKIGGPGPGEGNTIAFNTGNGVHVLDQGTPYNGGADIAFNSIHDNVALGIDLQGPTAGVTANDGDDSDVGPNGLQNFPDLSAPTTTSVHFSLTSAPSSNYNVEVFANSSCDTSTFGEGQIPLTAAAGDTDAGGVLTGTLTFSAQAPNTQLTATATNTTTGDTSEFSQCVPVPTTNADLEVQINGEPLAVTAGQPLSYSVDITNHGPDGATGVHLTSTPPDGADTVAAVPDVGTCTVNPTDVTCALGAIPSGTTVHVAMSVRTGTAPGTLAMSATATATSNEGADTFSNAANATVAANDATPGFAPARSYDLSGTGAHSVVTGDFNEDGHDDVIVSNSNGRASFLSGNANGHLDPSTAITLAGTPRWIAAAKVDGDTHLDLIANTEVCGASPTTCGTLQFASGNGDGTFDAPVAIDVGNAPASIVLADLNDDGKPDLIAADTIAKDVSVSFGNGNGTFAANATEYGTSGGMYGLAVGLVNADNHPDIVVTGGASAEVLINDGSGSFADPVSYPTGSTSATPTPTLADLNGDNAPDLVVSGSARVLINNGAGVFSAATEALGTSAYSTAVGDFNGDGQLDIEGTTGTATTASPDLVQARGAGDGTFSAGPNATLQYRATTSIVSAGLDTDTASDLVIPNASDNKVTVLLGTPTPQVTNLVVSHGATDTFSAGFSPLDQRSLNFAGVNLDPGILSGAAGPLDAPLQGRPLQGRPLQGRPLQGRPLQGRPLQGRPLQGRFLTDPPPSAFAFAPFEALVNHSIVDPPLITQIGLDVAGGWPAQLQGTLLANLPPQEIDLNEVIANATVWNRVRSITLDHFDLSQTPLGSLPPIAELAGSAKLTDFAPAGNWTGATGWLATMSPVCTSPVADFDPTQKTLVDLALLRCPLTVVPWETLRIQDFHLTATNSLLYSYGMLGIDPAAIPLRHGTNPLTTLGALTLNNVPTGIVDCSLFVGGCTSGHTLEEAFAQMRSTNDYVIQKNATFTKFLTGGATNGGGTTTPDDLLGDMTAEQFLLGAIAPQDFPYVLLSTGQLLDASTPSNLGAIPYSASFDVACPTATGTAVSFTLPSARFGFVRGSANFDIGTPVGSTVPAGPPTVNVNVLRWDLPNNATICGAQATGTKHVKLSFSVQPAPATGAFNASAKITTDDNDTLRTVDPTPITLNESGGPKTLADPQNLGPDQLVLGQFSSPSDVNFYNIPLTAADVGSLVTVVLSNGNETATAGVDNDLMLYGSAEPSLASAPLQGRPLQGRPIGDQEGCLPPGYVLNGQGLEGVPHFDTATLAVRSFSTNRSDYPEIVCTTVQESDVADGLTIQVSHFAGSTGDQPYVLSHTIEQTDVAAGCVGPAFEHAGDGQTPTSSQYSRVLDPGGKIPATAKTLFLIDAKRFGDLYGWDLTGTQPGSIAEKQVLDDLQALASRPEVDGYILPVETGTGSAVDAAYTGLDASPCSVTSANNVVATINDLVKNVETTGTDPRVRPDNVVIVGDDDVIPFARLRDGTTLGNQIAYAPTIRSAGGPNPISKAFGRGYILSDEPFGTTLAPLSILGNIVYVADTALGRLIETPAEIDGQIQQYISVGGVLDPKTRLSTGADFASAVGEQIADTFKKQTDALNAMPNTSGYSTKALLSSVSATGSQWTATLGWSKGQMLCRLDGFNANSGCTRTAPNRDFTPPGLISVSGHANHLATLAGNGVDTVSTDDIAGISRNATDGTAIPDGSLLFTIGCNAGVNVPDSYLPAPDNFDFPQALASRKGSFVGNFGFGYGDTSRLAFSEKLMKLFANNLDGSATIGQAITQAKGAYWSQLVSSSPYDIKSLEQSTLYGLPFYRITGAGTTNNQNAPVTEPDPDTGLPSTILSLPKQGSGDQYFVDPNDPQPAVDGQFFRGPNTQVVPGQPIQPTSNPFFLTEPGLRLHGALVTSLSVQDIPNFDPVIARLALDGTPGLGTEPIVESGVFPTAYSTLTTVQGDDYMVLNGGRFTATGLNNAGKFTGTQRVYTQESVKALWSDRSPAVQDFTPPDVSASGQLIGNGYATFIIRSLAPDVSAAYVMYRPGGGSHPDRFKLVRLLSTAPGVYSATVQVGTDGVSEFFGEVADTHGNVGFDVLKGASVALDTVSETPPAGVTTQIIPDSGTNLVNGFYSGPVDVKIDQRSFASIQTQVDFGPAQFFYPTSYFSGTSARVDVPSGTGTADGIHRVDYLTAGQSGTVIVPIDGLPPEIQYQIGSPSSNIGSGAPYVTPVTPISVVVTDAASGVRDCTIERFFPASATTGGVSFPCAEGSNPVTLGSDDGRYRFRTVATDNAGHSVTLDQILVVTRDTLPPTITPTVGSPRYTSSSPTPYVRTITDITMNIVDPPSGDVPGSGVATCATTVVGPIPSGGPDPASSNAGCNPGTADQIYHAAGADGDYRFDTTATDRLGNTGTGTQTVKLDNTPPTVNLSLPGSPTYVSGSTTFVTSATNMNTATADPTSISGPGSGVASCLSSLSVTGIMAPGTVATLPNPPGCTSPSHTYTLPSTTPDGPYRVTGTADDNVGNHNGGSAGSGSSGPLDVTLDNTAPIFGACPTAPLQRSATVLSSPGTGTGTTFNVNEEATPPRLPFVVKIDNELIKVTGRSLISGTTSQYKYTVARGQAGTGITSHVLNSAISWDLLARQDLLGTPTASISGTVPASGNDSFNVLEERFGAPATPFSILVDNEQMTVTGRTLVSGSTYHYTVNRAVNGTQAAPHATTSKLFWTGDAYGVVKTALNNTTGTTLVVQEGRFGPTSVPFDITVDGERMTVVQRTVVVATQVATYTVVRGVDGTKTVSHAVNAAVVPPPVGAVYLNSPVGMRTLSVVATDDVYPGVPGSGVASNASQIVPAGPVGTYPVTFTAIDNLGNTRTKLCSYEVIYKFSGFYLPVDMTVVNSRNAGAAVPTKWKITDFNLAAQTSPTTFKEITASKTIPASSASCSASNPDFSVASEDVRGGSALQNLGGGMWQYNWSPNTAPKTCTTMTVRLRQSGLSNPDPTRWYQYAVFSFK
jgi:uncharacterized repeat protein (TIGR01451 family)